MSRFTHEGTIRGADSRTPTGYQFRAALRQTKRYWVTTHGFQFRKEDGFAPGNWGMYRLDLDSVTPCTHNAPRDLRGDSRVTVHADVGHFESESQPDKKGGE